MNVLFVPTLGLDLTLMERLAASVDYPLKYKCAFNNGEPGALDSFRDAHPDWIVKESAFGNLGVAGSWNECAKMFPEEEQWLLMNDDAYFLPGYLEKICKCARLNETEPVIHLNHTNAYYCFVWSRRGKMEFGEFDENFWPGYCLAPETLVLKSDLNWVQIGSLNPGDELVGVEENISSQAGRKYITSYVKSIGTRFAPSVRITLEDGRDVICSTDHKWLTKFPQPSGKQGILWRWRATNEIRCGWRIYSPLRTWTRDSSFDTGWLSGLFDGEGCMHSSTHARGISLSQKEGFVLRRAIQILSQMRIHFTVYAHKSGVMMIDISKKRDALEVMGRLRPVRLIPKQKSLWEGEQVKSKNVESDLAVIDIEPLGVREVTSIETTSHTFIANGLVSHNCEDCDMRVRHRLLGYNGYVYALEGEPPLPHGKPKTGGMNYNAMLQGCGLLNRLYWWYKWGNQDFEKATYETPYKDHRLTVDQWVWKPEERETRRKIYDAWMALPNPSIYE